MPEGVFTITVSTAGLAPQQRQELDSQLRSEGIPTTWLGDLIQVDQAFEARVEGLVSTARAATPAAPVTAPGPAPAPTGFVATAPAYPAPAYPAPGPAYPPAGYPTGYGYAAAPLATNSNATTSLVLAIIGWVACPIASIFGVVYGRRALDEIADSGGTQSGEGMAKFGLIASWISIGLWGLVMLGFIVMFVLIAIIGAASS